ncbi:MAG: hypothetical protein M3P14_06980 [Chloroflexota bacterium]|nr:hypothetical protein [Chloroflexota bacterium]
MPETLTESFCERCGTRYEFTAPARLNTLRKTRGLVSGLKNYIMSQDTLTDAVGDALRSEEEALASHQLEAFHSAFNFCIDCRQYACTNCWNDAAGRCRSCVPIAGKDDLADRMEAAYLADHAAMHAATPFGTELQTDEISRRLGVEAWPESDLPEVAATNGHALVPWPDEIVGPALEPEPMVAQAEAAPAVELEPEPMAAEAILAAAEPEAEDVHPILAWDDDAQLVVRAPIEEALPEPEAEWVAAEQEPLLAAEAPEWVAAEVEPEPVLGAEVEPEPVVAAEAASWFVPEPEPVAAQEVVPEVTLEPEPAAAQREAMPEPEPIAAQQEVAPEPEPVAAEAEPQAPEPVMAPEPIRVFPRIRPISETIIRPPKATPPPPPRPAAIPVDDGALAARRAQLDLLGLNDPGEGTVGPERPRILPYRSTGAAVHPSEIVQRTMNTSAALWDASAREVAAARSAVAVQNCSGCGLSLSASARFCRRCGTRQAQSA